MEANPYESPREAIAQKSYDWGRLSALGIRLAAACFVAFLVINTMSPKPHSVGMLFVSIAVSTTVYGFLIGTALAIVGGIGGMINRKAASFPAEHRLRKIGPSPESPKSA
jgi:hypothetical protein